MEFEFNKEKDAHKKNVLVLNNEIIIIKDEN